MKYTQNLFKRINSIICYGILIIIAIVLVFPFFYMLMKSLMTSDEAVQPLRIIPEILQWHNYIDLFFARDVVTNNNYFTALLNSLYVIAFNMIAVPLSGSIIAYSFAKLKWWGRNTMFVAMMATVMLPSTVTQVPLYVMYSKWGWLNTFNPLTIPNLFGGGAMHIFLIRQFMLGLPNAMDEAAKLDGANAFQRYLLITLPLCRAILVYIMVTVFIGNWSDYYGPLIYMTSSKAPRTLAYVVFLSSMQENVGVSNANIRMAAGVFMSIIPLILYTVFQRELVEGIAVSGVKG